ncbi:MAG: carbohydrate kinase family protein [Lachnospiraceae bacterium]|nr:carbohydrate kinase family protein [Lachnospiraceae bacterium]
MAGKKVIVAGHICLDITPVFPESARGKGSEILMPGKLVETKAASVSTGGAVANTGLAMKILCADPDFTEKGGADAGRAGDEGADTGHAGDEGADASNPGDERTDVRLMGKVGTDDIGDMICNILKRYDADKDMIRSEDEDSSYSVVLALPGIDRMFLHCPGANNTYGSADIPDEALGEATLLHFGYPPLMKKMYDNGGRELADLFKRAHDAGCATSLDMAAIDPATDAGSADWNSILEKVIPFVDFFVPSIEELCFMIDRERFAEWQERINRDKSAESQERINRGTSAESQKHANGGDITEILDVDKDIRPIANRCMEMGCKVLLLKCGAPGLYYRTASRDVIAKIPSVLGLDIDAWAEKEGFERSYKPDAVLSGTGAGDTSIAAYLTSMLEGNPPEECIRLAAATGACCVSAYDALSGLKPLSELRKRIDAGWEKN